MGWVFFFLELKKKPDLSLVTKDICAQFTTRKYTAKVGQDNVNIGVVTIFRLANTSLFQVKPEEGWCWPAEIL